MASRHPRRGDAVARGSSVGRSALAVALPEPFSVAMSALAACADAASMAGHSLASTYVAGASGNLRHAMACLSIKPRERGSFDMSRVGGSELIGQGGQIDTITRCLMPDGPPGTVRALVPRSIAEEAVWLRSDPALPGLVVRGSVRRGDEGMSFSHEPAFVEGGISAPVPAPDLGRCLLAADFAISGGDVEAVAWELTLASGSWVHLESGRRWYADRQAARALVRMMGGVPSLTDEHAARLGVAVDRDVLLAIEALGWRHWVTPGLDR